MIKEGYIDTCLLAAYYCPEPLSNTAERLLLSIKQPIISLLTEVELLSVLSRKYRKKELDKHAVQQIIATYKAHLKEGYYHKITVKSEHYICANNLLSSLTYPLHSLDALHLAIAVSEKIPLITLDRALEKISKKIGTYIY